MLFSQAPTSLQASLKHSKWLKGNILIECQTLPTKGACKHICNVSDQHSLLLPLASGALVACASAMVIPRASEKLKPRKCLTCYGAGYYPCNVCFGRGKVGGCLPGAMPLQTCVSCESRGRTRCHCCKGQGITNTWLWQPAKDPGWGPRGE